MKKIFFILALAALAVYFNALNNDFVWDDRFLIENNDLIKDPRRIPSIFTTDLYHFTVPYRHCHLWWIIIFGGQARSVFI